MDPLVDPSAALLDLSTVLFAIDIHLYHCSTWTCCCYRHTPVSLLDLDMLLPRLLLCVYLLCLDYLFLLPQTIPPSLGIALTRVILFSFPLSSQSSLLLFLHLSLKLSFSLHSSLPLFFPLSFHPSVSFPLVDAPFFSFLHLSVILPSLFPILNADPLK